MDKSEMIKSLFKQREMLEKAHAAAIKTSNEMDGKMQSRYDTQKEEWAAQANLLAHNIARVNQLIKELSETKASESDSVSIGAEVTISINGDQPETYIIVDDVGGVKMQNISSLSTKSPIGSAILGAKLGDKISTQVNTNTITVEILSVNT